MDKKLNSVDYKKLNERIPSKFALQFGNFIKLVNGKKGEENKSSIIHYDMLSDIIGHENNLIVSFRGSAKALALDTNICTSNGSIKMRNIQIGDIILDRYGNPTKVTHVSEIYTNQTYEITLENDESFIANEDHLHILIDSESLQETVLSTKELLNSNTEYYIPLGFGNHTKESYDFKIKPYTWGLMFGNRIIHNDELSLLTGIKIDVKKVKKEYSCLLLSNKSVFIQDKKITKLFEEDVPLYADKVSRNLFLKGVLDVCGENFKCNLGLYKKLNSLLKSLGHYATMSDTGEVTVELHKSYMKIKSIQATKECIESRCISVDSPSKSFMIEDFIVTHNTTVMAEYMILYLATFGELPDLGDVTTGIYVSDTMDNGVRTMGKNLESRYYNSEFLMKNVPEIKLRENEWEFTNKDGHKLTFRGFGYNTGIRGVKAHNKRPNIAILDDLMSDKNASSSSIISDIENTVYNAVWAALAPERKIIWIGTPFNKKDPLYKAASSTVWNTKVYPIAEKFPCDKEEFIGAWEDRFNYEFVKRQYDSFKAIGRINSFNQEFMLRVMSDDDRLVLDSEILFYDDSVEIPVATYYMTTDFAVSEKQSADYNVALVWAYTPKKEFLLVDGYVARMSIVEAIDRIFELGKKYNVQNIVMEKSGQQKGFIDIFAKQMIERSTYFYLGRPRGSSEAGYPMTKEKLARFNNVVPLFKTGRIKFPESKQFSFYVNEVIENVKSVTYSGIKSAHDDALDCVSQLALIMPYVNELPQSKESKKDIDRNPYSIYDKFDSMNERNAYEDYL